jgi:hypothetical protein
MPHRAKISVFAKKRTSNQAGFDHGTGEDSDCTPANLNKRSRVEPGPEVDLDEESQRKRPMINSEGK